MSEAKPTPGPWVAVGTGGPWEQRLNIRAAHWGCVASVGVDPSMPHWDGPQRANARLIADAGTVFHTTGLTPSQLVERVKELEEAAKLVLDWYEAENDHSKTDFYQRVQMCRDSEDALRAALSRARPNTAEGEAHGEAQVDAADLRKALQFYADGHHFVMHDETAWDTVSGEPVNFYEDEAGTATVEDGSIAKLALAGHPIKFEDEDIATPPNSVLEDAAILAGWRAALACHATWGQSGWSSHREQYLAAARKQAAAKEPSP